MISDGQLLGVSDYIYLTTDSNGIARVFGISIFLHPGERRTLQALPQLRPLLPIHWGTTSKTTRFLTSVTSTASDTSITGSLNGQASTTFYVEFFANSTDDPTGYGQGQTFLGSTFVTTDNTGNMTFNVDLPVGNLAGQWITATATDPQR